MNFKLFTVFIMTLFSVSLHADQLTIKDFEKFDSWIYDSFNMGNPITESSITSIGDILLIESEDYHSGHSSSPLKFNTYTFNGLIIKAIVHQTNEKNALPNNIVISSSEWTLVNGLKIGSPVSDLKKLPIEPKKGTLNYCGLNNCIVFKAGNGLVSSIAINLYAE